MFLKSSLLSSVKGIAHGFGTSNEPIPQFLGQLWNTARPIWKQVHGIDCAHVRSPQQSCGQVDGLYSQEKGIPIGIATADCVPLLFTHRKGQMVAAVHAGWRGTRAHITSQLLKNLKSLGQDPQDWVVAIGPAIGPCCYEVSEELAAEFEQEFSALGKGVAVPEFRKLDLPGIHQAELRQLGFAEVDLLRYCTRCSSNPAFHSYRRDGGGTRQYSVILKIE